MWFYLSTKTYIMGTQKNYLNHTQNKCLNQWIGMDSQFYVQNVILSEPMVLINCTEYTSRDMRFPTMWYVRPAKAQTSLRIRTVWSEPLLVTWLFFEC